jgi:arylsulfatase A-like enzyme
MTMRASKRRGALAALAVTCALVVAGTLLIRWMGRGNAVARPNVVIVVMDTARLDRLSCYGYGRDTSPRLRELAKEATVFDRAYSTTSWTCPAHASIFTGLYPTACGVTQEHWKMSEDLVTLAEVLSQNGYETVAIVENPVLSDRNGYDQGFSTYHMTWRIDRELAKRRSGQRPEPGSTAVSLFLGAVRRRAERPLFVFVNLVSPHSPYDSSGRFMYEFVTERDISLVENMWREHYLGRRTLTEAELRHLGELYDAELLYTDSLVGAMIDGLKETGRWDDTFFVVTSDHGENIGDHGHVDHVFSLHESLVRVPLIVHDPARPRRGAVDGRPVQLVDLFPTVLEAAGVSAEAFPNQGLSLLSGRIIPPDRAIVTEYEWPAQVLSCFDESDRDDPALAPYKRALRSINVGGTKLIWASEGQQEAYDLSADPTESVNAWDDWKSTGAVASLEAGLTEALTVFEAGRKVLPEDVSTDAVDEATREALRSLGYLR